MRTSCQRVLGKLHLRSSSVKTLEVEEVLEMRKARRREDSISSDSEEETSPSLSMMDKRKQARLAPVAS